MANTEAVTYLTGDFNYTMRTTEHLQRVAARSISLPCTIIEVYIANEQCQRIRCFNRYCFSNYDLFGRHWKHKVCGKLVSCYPLLSVRSVNGFAENFVSFFNVVNADHTCPHQHKIRHVISHVVEFHVHPRAAEEEEEDRVLMESFEEVGSMMKPATREYVEGLISDRSRVEMEECERFEIDWRNVDRQCVICMDQIEKRGDSIAMSCLHVFHEDCVVKCLSKSHVCPLCRYEMPFNNRDVD